MNLAALTHTFVNAIVHSAAGPVGAGLALVAVFAWAAVRQGRCR